MLNPDIFQLVCKETNIPYEKIKNTVQLLDMGNTIPFITRYRKEITGELDENQIRLIDDKVNFFRNLEQRKKDIIRLIEEQGKMTEDLRRQILGTWKSMELEDLYLPFRPKKKTRAGAAREKGLEPLAAYLLSFPQEGSPEKEASLYLSEQVTTPQDALQGAMDIVAENSADDAEVRKWVRQYTYQQGFLAVKAKDGDQDSVYRMYYNFTEPVKKIVPHRILAINRGEREKYLNVSLEIKDEPVLEWLDRRFVKPGTTSELVKKAVRDGYKRLVAPAIEREIRGMLTEKAEKHAIILFSQNLRSLLLQPPVADKTVLGVDPAYRTGCKWAVLDSTGKLLEVGVVYPTPPHNKKEEAKKELKQVIQKYGINAIAIGNGTASRETEQLVAELISEYDNSHLAYTIVSEAGASVYSASGLAAQEFPALDASQRSAVSIGRRVQDPLAELVKIPPQAVGVGQYQHDLPEKSLKENLAIVVESVVNYVGVDLNTASASLLSYVSGINTTVAKNIVAFREENNRFTNRSILKQVPKLGAKTFEQCAGFLKINKGENLLDNTTIHPESYQTAYKLLELAKLDLKEIGTEKLNKELRMLKENNQKLKEAAGIIGSGLPTLNDIIDNLLRPGRDPREELDPPVFRTDVLELEDLEAGMVLKGTVRNVTDFGAFVDIGVKQDGLVHLSEMAETYIKHPLEVVTVGDVVTVLVLSVDIERGRISLSMKQGLD